MPKTKRKAIRPRKSERSEWEGISKLLEEISDRISRIDAMVDDLIEAANAASPPRR